MNFTDHPITALSKWFAEFEQASVDFSQYRYTARTADGPRSRFRVPTADVTTDWLRNRLAELEPDKELAIHSLVVLSDGSERHIPMADLQTRNAESARAEMQEVAVDFGLKRPLVYDSGRSFHVYWLNLIKTKMWVRFMGRLLLSNAPGNESVVDPRWVGHRLVAGYSALRWSLNTPHYLGMPRRVAHSIRTPQDTRSIDTETEKKGQSNG